VRYIDKICSFIDNLNQLYKTPNCKPMDAYKNIFTNGEVIVTYEPSRCIHAEACAKGLSSVFKTSVIPWIDLEGATTKKIISQVKKCPSGALSCSKVRTIEFVKDFVI
jgi:uncharacterized Fe-S cluster protein YjdI